MQTRIPALRVQSLHSLGNCAGRRFSPKRPLTLRHISPLWQLQTTPARFSSSQPVATMQNEPPAKSLQDLAQVSGAVWQLLDEPRRLEQTFKFGDFAAAWKFMGDVALKCEEKNHHPEWSNVYNQVFIRWTTHRPPGGVRKKDREMATICEELARHYGAEIVGSSGNQAANSSESGMGSLVEGAGGARCDCGDSHPSAKQ